MLEGKALVVAIMMLTAAPLVATDDGRAIVGDVTRDVTDMFADSEPLPAENPGLDEIIDDADKKTNEEDLELDRKDPALNDTKEDKSCYYLDEVKEKMSSEKKGKDKDEDRGEESDRDEDRSEESEEITSLIGMERQEALDFLEESGLTYRYCDLDGDDGCAMTDDFVPGRHTLEFEDGVVVSHEVEEEYTNDDELEYPLPVIDEEQYALMEELKLACEDGNEESCEELRTMIAEIVEEKKDDFQIVIGDDGVVYYEDKDRKDWDKEGKDWNKDRRDWSKECLTKEQWEKVFEKARKEKNDRFNIDRIEMSVKVMLEMIEDIDEEEIAKIKQVTNVSDEEWNHMIEKLQSKNMTEEDWKKVMKSMKMVIEHKVKEERAEMEAFRAQMKEFDDACEAGNETACEELYEMMEEIEEDFREDKENKEECDDESDESDEDESGEDEYDNEESDEDDSDEDESEEDLE